MRTALAAGGRNRDPVHSVALVGGRRPLAGGRPARQAWAAATPSASSSDRLQTADAGYVTPRPVRRKLRRARRTELSGRSLPSTARTCAWSHAGGRDVLADLVTPFFIGLRSTWLIDYVRDYLGFRRRQRTVNLRLRRPASLIYHRPQRPWRLCLSGQPPTWWQADVNWSVLFQLQQRSGRHGRGGTDARRATAMLAAVRRSSPHKTRLPFLRRRKSAAWASAQRRWAAIHLCYCASSADPPN